jgi:hypothetical protein
MKGKTALEHCPHHKKAHCSLFHDYSPQHHAQMHPNKELPNNTQQLQP